MGTSGSGLRHRSDTAAAGRDAAADDREVRSKARDVAADARDQAAELAEIGRGPNGPEYDALVKLAGEARAEAAEDRKLAAEVQLRRAWISA